MKVDEGDFEPDSDQIVKFKTNLAWSCAVIDSGLTRIIRQKRVSRLLEDPERVVSLKKKKKKESSSKKVKTRRSDQSSDKRESVSFQI